jgi:phosphatidylserine decarboxylase
MPAFIEKLSTVEQLNFVLTNRIPRRALTRFMGWYSRLEIPWLTRLSIAVWKRFAPDLDFSASTQDSFSSIHACFTRELRPGARTIDRREHIIVSPCDAVVGAHGVIDDGVVHQIKGFPYHIDELISDAALCQQLMDGVYVTLRLKSSMYHRFHAPCDADVSEILYLSGDTWNVNPITLKRIEKLFCRNERAVVKLQLDDGSFIVLVPVAAILVASMRFHCLPDALNLGSVFPYRNKCQAHYAKGDEMGYFEHGSTIVAFAPRGFTLHGEISEGQVIRMGSALMNRPGKANLSTTTS